MRYVIARYNYEMRDMTYRFYVSDELFVINNNLADSYVGGSTLTKKYSDILEMMSTRNRHVEERTPEEIIDGLKERMRELK